MTLTNPVQPRALSEEGLGRDSYAVLQEGILCDVFSQKCSAAWQGARGERLTVGIMLPGPQEADDWLNFMLSQKNLWPTFTM